MSERCDGYDYDLWEWELEENILQQTREREPTVSTGLAYEG